MTKREPVRRKVLMLIGLPASGKTTHARALMQEEPGRWIHVSRDDLRLMVTGRRRPSHDERREELLRSLKLEITRLSLAKGFDVILDDTHLLANTRAHIRSFVADLGGDIELVELAFDVPVDECLRRNALRDPLERVPKRVIVGMAARAVWPTDEPQAASVAPGG